MSGPVTPTPAAGARVGSGHMITGGAMALVSSPLNAALGAVSKRAGTRLPCSRKDRAGS